MKKVSNLSELVDLVGKDTVNKCFTEYMMLMVARNNKVNELENDLENMNDTDVAEYAMTLSSVNELIDLVVKNEKNLSI